MSNYGGCTVVKSFVYMLHILDRLNLISTKTRYITIETYDEKPFKRHLKYYMPK
jgi:hypothetical protein